MHNSTSASASSVPLSQDNQVAKGSTKEQAAQLEAKGFSGAQIAEQLHVTAGYISQLQSDTSYQTLLAKFTAASRLNKQATYQVIDDNYDQLEKRFSSMLIENEDIYLRSMLAKPQLLNQFMKNLNQMTRRAAGEQGGLVPDAYIEVNLPNFITEVAVGQAEHNTNNEVIAVDGEPLLSMPSKQLESFAASSALVELPPELTVDRLDLD